MKRGVIIHLLSDIFDILSNSRTIYYIYQSSGCRWIFIYKLLSQSLMSYKYTSKAAAAQVSEIRTEAENFYYAAVSD